MYSTLHNSYFCVIILHTDAAIAFLGMFSGVLLEEFKLNNQTILSKHFIKQTLADNRETLRKYGVKQIGLFGSYVNGTAHALSDIDLLVELERLTFHDYMGLALFLEDLFEKKVDLVTAKSIKPHLRPYIEVILSKI